jgi:type IV pilus assembly protein PilV
MKNFANIKSNKQTGAMLIEVLVSILLFSFGLLGLVGLQGAMTQNAVNAEGRTIASNMANEMVSQMWLKNTAKPANLTAEIAAWNTKVTAALPSGSGTVTATGGITTVTVKWHPTSRKTTENDSKYDTQVAIE